MRKAVLTSIVLLAMAGALFATGAQEGGAKQSSQPKTLRYAFWGNPTAIGVEQDIINAYVKLHPNVTVEPVVSAYADYHSKILVMIAVEEGNKERVLTMLKCLSRTLRAAIRGARNVITFAEELENVESFVLLERMRFAGRFEMQSDVEKDVLACGVCQFSVQPLVENAFIHGVQETGDFITIRLSIRRDGDRILVDITDTGPGAPPDILAKLQESFSSGENKLDHWSALVGVNNRLRMIYGRPFGLSLLPVEKGFGLRVTCPIVAPTGMT